MKRIFMPRTLAGGIPPIAGSAIAAIGPMSSALEVCRGQLASCLSYQAFLNLSGSDAAAARTYLAALPAPANGVEYTAAEWEATLRPFGMIYTSTSGGYSLARSALYATRENGRCFIELEITIPAAYQPDPDVAAVDLTLDLERADRWILNQLGQIAAEFMGKSGEPGSLDVSQLTLLMGPSRERHEEPLATGYYYWMLLEVVWGATG